MLIGSGDKIHPSVFSVTVFTIERAGYTDRELQF